MKVNEERSSNENTWVPRPLILTMQTPGGSWHSRIFMWLSTRVWGPATCSIHIMILLITPSIGVMETQGYLGRAKESPWPALYKYMFELNLVYQCYFSLWKWHQTNYALISHHPPRPARPRPRPLSIVSCATIVH